MRTSHIKSTITDGLVRQRKPYQVVAIFVVTAIAFLVYHHNFHTSEVVINTSRDSSVILNPKKEPLDAWKTNSNALRHVEDANNNSKNTAKELLKGAGRTSPPPRFTDKPTVMAKLADTVVLPQSKENQYNDPKLLPSTNKTLNSSDVHVDPFKYFTFENAPFEQYALNVKLSQSLPLHRPVPDHRPKKCPGKHYPLSRPHKVSIIVPFHNEMWAVLLRTVHSLLDNSPPELLHEIILVDDCSNFDNLLAPLTAYVKAFPKIRLFRLKQREGLIRARVAGARLATGDILAFIDAHVECGSSWLEPLVDLVARERTTIALPVINSVNPLTFQHLQLPVKSSGIFTWDLDYVWKDVLINYDQVGIEPHPTATMIGCAFVVDRDFFFNVGSFDEGMEIWGGEQIEISFRTWMCGGSVKIVPCSQVSHIYRAHLPYAFDKYILYRNLQRIAEVWMDDYKRYFYYTIKADPHKLTKEEYATVQARKDLRRKLQCKPFSWYLEKLAPDIEAPPTGAILFGQFRNIGSQHCLHETNVSKFDFHEVDFSFCNLQTKDFTFSFMDSGHIMHAGKCLTYSDTKDSAVTLSLCDQSDIRQLWQFKPGIPDAYRRMVYGAEAKRELGSFQLKYGGLSLCLSQMLHQGVNIAGALDCGARNSHQFWVITYSIQYNSPFKEIYSNTGIHNVFRNV